MLRRVTVWILSILPVILLSACALPPVAKVDAVPTALTKIKTIAVIRPPEPTNFTVANFGHPGMAFGLIGGLAAASDQETKQNQLSKVYKDAGFSFSAELAQRIANALNAAGYQARVEEGPWEKAGDKYNISFEKIRSDADAVLVVATQTVGYVATGPTDEYSNDYLPTIAAVVNLFGDDRKTPLYRGYHATGWKRKAEGWKYTPPKARFSTFDALIFDPKKSADTLLDATSNIASTIAIDLKRN